MNEIVKLMKHFLLIIFLFLLVSCELDKRVITIEGAVYDPNLEQVVVGVDVSLYTQSGSGGTFNLSFVKQETTVSDENGKFLFEHTYDYTSAYKIEFEKENYFSNSFEFQSEAIPNDDIYNKDFLLYPQAGIKIHIVNQYPFDENDKIKFRIIDWQTQCESCCYTSFHEMIGTNINEVLECNLFGEKEYTVEYLTWKNGNQNASHRIVFCPAFETSDVEISF